MNKRKLPQGNAPLDQVAELKQAIQEARKADQLAEKAAVRTFMVFREMKFGKPTGPQVAIDILDRTHDQLGDARAALQDALHQLERLLQRAGFTLPARDE